MSLSIAVSLSLLQQLRALDWDVAGPLQDYPTVVVYHPHSGHSFANVGWSGWLTTISGNNSIQYYNSV